MKSALKFVMALTVTILLMLAFRALVFTVYTVRGTAIEPAYKDGDRVLVNRWSYGLRTGGGGMFAYSRWAERRAEKGELVVFNCPQDTLRPVRRREVMAYYCTGVPGDTARAWSAALALPCRGEAVAVTKDNIELISHIYNRYEGRTAGIRSGQLYVDGRRKDCAVFKYDYYWLAPTSPDGRRDTARGMLVPDNHVIGRVVLKITPTRNKTGTHHKNDLTPTPTLPKGGSLK